MVNDDPLIISRGSNRNRREFSSVPWGWTPTPWNITLKDPKLNITNLKDTGLGPFRDDGCGISETSLRHLQKHAVSVVFTKDSPETSQEST